MVVNVISEIPGLNTEDLTLNGFKVHKLPVSLPMSVVSGRRDFYKMGLVTGKMTVTQADKNYQIDGTVLFFVNPNIPHSISRRIGKTAGYACLFTDRFLSGSGRTGILKNSPLFQVGDSPVISLTNDQAAFMTAIFQKMLAVHGGEYAYRSELIRSCIQLIIHEALRIQPSQTVPEFKNAATRMTHLFLDLLERQFPIEQTNEPLKLRTPQDFAVALSVHINYLNRAIKEVTGKPTSAHITERIVAEATALLQYTDWSVADIAYALGFEYPTYFNNYFKRVTGITPNSLRKEIV